MQASKAGTALPEKKATRSEHEFQNLLRRLELALDASRIGVWEHSIEQDGILWDAQMHRLYETGETCRLVPASLWSNAIHPDDRERAERDFEQAIAMRGAYNSQFRIVLPSGEIRHLRSRAHFYVDAEGEPSFIGAEWDVTADVLLNAELARQKVVAEARALALEESNARIEHVADHDYLTGLPNRRLLDKRLAELPADKSITTLGVLHLDLDQFKQINDSHGHAAGDAVLRAAALRITAAIPANGMVARVGGDEFVIVLVNFTDLTELKQITEDVQRRLRKKIRFGQEMLQSGASIGVSWSGDRRARNLFAESDLALYQAKKLGRNRVEFFTRQLQEDLRSKRRLAEELKLGLERGQILPYYQVQLDARTREVIGFEALARWKHPEKGVLAPGIFLKVADEQGLAAEIDAAILKSVLEDRLFWLLHGLAVPRIAVNISASRLADPALLDKLRKLDIPPGVIVFELVETIFLDDSDEKLLAHIGDIKQMGIDIEIDDFGSGHASLIGLVKLRPKRLKIDRQLVTEVVSSAEQRRVVGSIVEIAKALDVEVIAEGIETEAHAVVLAQLGCDGLQGYAFGYPAPAAETDRLFSSMTSRIEKQKAAMGS
ncbi:EAL domain-containing protein [Rhizobium leguminosarum bv. viciae]|uniref:EAL domain-containing protein n=1 Tax=Rhizobium leguminosarum bv. viciae TaxID=387 RepID=A0A4R0BLT7_RHILV|nr:GGDEF domain-containing phosphodiesterase [Rhizobium leguminosarum]MBY5786456.1 EAL domain-containing protein [Rhizobium leguminosarum]MBY5789630.1 EAL domain-containing protein [Rhizobium leguminosarum]NKM48389.1 EAL domain-containing protein [Rhizobium leguminosarum bv. viciae]TBZ08590.1 EAL domain-containing protein [Rhizobium leguminosarum bv. viciae]TBZ13430.1 EAL domain-containing protein [Rhizobium leguminosarum bv. viciae]